MFVEEFSDSNYVCITKLRYILADSNKRFTTLLLRGWLNVYLQFVLICVFITACYMYVAHLIILIIYIQVIY